MPDLHNVLKDLTADADDLDRVLTGLAEWQWELDSPAPGWTVKHQVGHLTFIFDLAGTAASDPARFQAMIAAAKNDFDGAVNAALAQYLGLSPVALFDRWQATRAATIDVLSAAPPDQPVPWLVNPLPPAVLSCAGVMELFAHGQDIHDGLGIRREPTDRLRHLVEFALLTRPFGYLSRGLPPPQENVRVEVVAPSGEVWSFGPADATQKVTGPAYDFCLLVTRRRHRDDLALVAYGEEADQWLDVAQAYRGPAGPGRQPGQFDHIGR